MTEKTFSQQDMISFAEFVTTFPDKNRNYKDELLHAKSRYDSSNKTIDLLHQWSQLTTNFK